MYQDRQGNLLSGANPAAVDHFDSAVRAFNIYRGDPIADLDRAIEAAPEFAMAHLLKAQLYGLATEPEAAAEAVALVDRARHLRTDDRERSHIAVLDRLLAGDWNAAASAMDLHNMRYPRDLVGLQVGHLMDFYRGNARNLRDRIARALPHWSESVPGHHAVLGMQSFGLEESGSYEAAEDAGMAALDAHPDDVWAIHAVAHAHEMRGRVADGVDLYESRVPDWGSGNLFTVHNWWHLALFKLEQGDVPGVLDIYDREVHHPGSDGVALEMLDASALLWRLHLDGTDVSDRWAPLAEAWTAADGAPWYAFNDLHAAMAYAGAGRMGDARRVVDRLEAHVAQGDGGSNVMMTAEVGLPASRAVVAFSEGRYDDTVAELAPRRRWFNRFGGSHAQRDVLQRTLLEAAVRGGQHDLARALVSERLALRPTSAYARSQSTRLP